MLVTDRILGYTKLRSHENMFPNLIIFKGAFKVTDPTFPPNIYFRGDSASLQKRNSLMSHREALALSQAALGSLGSSLLQPISLHKPKLSLNQLNSRRDGARLPKEATPACQLPWL